MEFEYGEYQVKVYPPMQANVDSSVSDVTSSAPLMDAISELDQPAIITPTSTIKINGQEIIQANLFQLDLLAQRDFNRTASKHDFDPPAELLFELANNAIGKIRSVGRLSHVKLISPDTAVGWKVDYLTDIGQPLIKDEKFARGHVVPKLSWQISGITADLWKLAFTLPVDFKPTTWDTLILDAFSQLPNVNTSIVLANAALESFINYSLDVLAKDSSIHPEAWEWVRHRGEDWLKQPSVKERYDQVLFLLTGRSLKKEQKDLWTALDHLRMARNSMVHQGRALIKKKTKKHSTEVEVSPDMAKEMVSNSTRIISWVESIMPEEKRRIFFKGTINYQFNRKATGPEKSARLMAVKGDIDRIKLSIAGYEDD